MNQRTLVLRSYDDLAHACIVAVWDWLGNVIGSMIVLLLRGLGYDA